MSRRCFDVLTSDTRTRHGEEGACPACRVVGEKKKMNLKWDVAIWGFFVSFFSVFRYV